MKPEMRQDMMLVFIKHGMHQYTGVKNHVMVDYLAECIEAKKAEEAELKTVAAEIEAEAESGTSGVKAPLDGAEITQEMLDRLDKKTLNLRRRCTYETARCIISSEKKGNVVPGWLMIASLRIIGLRKEFERFKGLVGSRVGDKKRIDLEIFRLGCIIRPPLLDFLRSGKELKTDSAIKRVGTLRAVMPAPGNSERQDGFILRALAEQADYNRRWAGKVISEFSGSENKAWLKDNARMRYNICLARYPDIDKERSIKKKAKKQAEEMELTKLGFQQMGTAISREIVDPSSGLSTRLRRMEGVKTA